MGYAIVNIIGRNVGILQCPYVVHNVVFLAQGTPISLFYSGFVVWKENAFLIPILNK